MKKQISEQISDQLSDQIREQIRNRELTRLRRLHGTKVELATLPALKQMETDQPK